MVCAPIMHQTLLHTCIHVSHFCPGKGKASGYGTSRGKPLEILFKSQLCHQLVRPGLRRRTSPRLTCFMGKMGVVLPTN